MRKEVFAVCDPDKEYTAAFLNYLTRRNVIPMETVAFTESTALLRYAKEKPVDMLLIHPGLLTREVKELPAASVVLLTEGNIPPDTVDYPMVSKYQRCSEVIRQAMAQWKGAAGTDGRSIAVKRSMEILGVFSPVGRSGKTLFALTLAQILGRSMPALYVNFESYSGFSALMEENGESCLSDLLYYSGQESALGNGSLMRCLAGTVRKAGRIDYIPPVKLPWDMREALSDEILNLLDAVALESGYEVLVADIGNEVENVLHVLERCSRVIMPVFRDRISLAKTAQFEKALKDWGAEDVLNNIVQIRPPEMIPTGSGTALLEQLESGSMGAYVRQFLKKHPLSL